MKIEIERFPDGRLKLVKRYARTDRNFRIESDGASVVPKNAEVKLEREVLQAINLWNAMKRHTKLREEIMHALKRYGIEI